MKKHIKKQLLLYFPILFPNKKKSINKKNKILSLPFKIIQSQITSIIPKFFEEKKIKNKM